MDIPIKEFVVVGLAAASAVAAFAVAQYRITEVETKVIELRVKVDRNTDERMKLGFVERDMTRVKCEIKNVKLLLKDRPEEFCP